MLRVQRQTCKEHLIARRIQRRIHTAPAQRAEVAVHVIADNRVTDVRQVHAQLMGAPGVEPQLEQGVGPQVFKDAPGRTRLQTVGAHPHLHVRVAVEGGPDGRADFAGRRGDALDEGEVGLAHQAPSGRAA